MWYDSLAGTAIGTDLEIGLIRSDAAHVDICATIVFNKHLPGAARFTDPIATEMQVIRTHPLYGNCFALPAHINKGTRTGIAVNVKSGTATTRRRWTERNSKCARIARVQAWMTVVVNDLKLGGI